MPISIVKDIVDERHHRDTVNHKKKREDLEILLQNDRGVSLVQILHK